MLLDELLSYPETIARYAERFINDGSPSGFSERHSTSAETSPFGFKPHFQLLSLHAHIAREFGDIGNAPLLQTALDTNAIYLHPDMSAAASTAASAANCAVGVTNMRAVPTASGRTVQVISDDPNDYLKLHYNGILGRMTRELTFAKAVAGPETSRLIEAAIRDRRLPRTLHLLPEPYARVLTLQTVEGPTEWGMVYRSATPLGAHKIDILLPSFALFSTDRLHVHHPTLISQILNEMRLTATEYFMEAIVAPIVDCYFALLCELGLQAEWNAQNLMVGFSDGFANVAIVMRDLESVDKDITLMRERGLATEFESAPYKCISSDQYNYQIKHSFMFDFKLGDCVLKPLFEAAAQCLQLTFEMFADAVRDRVRVHLKHLPDAFFPQGRWYSFDRVMVDRATEARPYVEHTAPPFRK